MGNNLRKAVLLCTLAMPFAAMADGPMPPPGQPPERSLSIQTSTIGWWLNLLRSVLPLP